MSDESYDEGSTYASMEESWERVTYTVGKDQIRVYFPPGTYTWNPGLLTELRRAFPEHALLLQGQNEHVSPIKKLHWWKLRVRFWFIRVHRRINVWICSRFCEDYS